MIVELGYSLFKRVRAFGIVRSSELNHSPVRVCPNEEQQKN